VKEPLPVTEFVLKLAEGDLDPAVTLLRRGHAAGVLADAQVDAWLLAHWLFFHPGVASYLAEFHDDPASFWHEAHAKVEEYPRGPERGHFKGAAAHKCLDCLAARYPNPASPASDLKGITRYDELVSRLRGWPLFGSWVTFRVAGHLEGVYGASPDTAGAAPWGFVDVRDALMTVYPQVRPEDAFWGLLDALDGRVSFWQLGWALSRYYRHLRGADSPGRAARTFAGQTEKFGALARRLRRCLPGWRLPHQVVCWDDPERMVSVFDAEGRQVEDLQGPYDDVRDEVLTVSGPDVEFRHGTWDRVESFRVSREEW
jgi:hypothetical protein